MSKQRKKFQNQRKVSKNVEYQEERGRERERDKEREVGNTSEEDEGGCAC